MISPEYSRLFSILSRSGHPAASQALVFLSRIRVAVGKALKAAVVVLLLSLLAALQMPANADDSQFDLQPYAGKVVYLDFWASWCTPCRASFPFMYELAAEFAEELVVVAVNLDKKRELADAFLADFDVNFEIVYDPEGQIASEYDLKGMPTSFLLDRSGEPVAQHIGFRKKDVARLHAAVKAEVERQSAVNTE